MGTFSTVVNEARDMNLIVQWAKNGRKVTINIKKLFINDLHTPKVKNQHFLEFFSSLTSKRLAATQLDFFFKKVKFDL